MSYKVLARKWRPQRFADVVGQKHILSVLVHSLAQQRLHHAYLFSGVRGVGKTTIARLFAKGLNCKTGVSHTPCGKCINCVEITHGRFIDLIEIDAASRTKVEDTRELLDNVQYLPIRGRFKVYLIDEVHMLSRHSFNALLKTLEEPPQHVKFLLATTDPQKLPITVLSRCLQLHLRTLNIEQICNYLQKILSSEKILSDKPACHLIAKAAKGSLRDALSLTDQAIAMGNGQVSTNLVSQMLGVLNSEQPLELIEAIVQSNNQKIMSLVEDIALCGNNWDNVLIEMLSLIHRIAMIQLLPIDMEDIPIDMQDSKSSLEERLCLLARSITPVDLQIYYQILLLGRKELPYAPENRIGVEMILLRIMTLNRNDDNPKVALLSSLNKIQSINFDNNINIHTNTL